MIIHSFEYYHALKKEMESLKAVMESKQYVSDIPFVMEGIKDEIRVCDLALNSVKCNFCIHRISSENRCAVNGTFPQGLDINNYSCVNWVFDDVPF